MGVTIHYEGVALSEAALQTVLDVVRAEANRLGWPITDMSSDDGVLERVIDEEERDYHGRVRGVVIQPHPESEPLHVLFGDDRFLQDYCKTQFAGASTHVAVVNLLRHVAPHFAELRVIDEADFWDTGDVGALQYHFASFERALANLLTEHPDARTKIRLPSGRIIDALT